MPGLIVKPEEMFLEDDPIVEDSDDDYFYMEDCAQEPTTEERLAILERKIHLAWLTIEAEAKADGLTEILPQLPVGPSIPTQERTIEERLADAEMQVQLAGETVARILGIDYAEIQARLPVGLSTSYEPGQTSVPTIDAPTKLAEDAVVDQMTMLDAATVDTAASQPDSTSSPPIPTSEAPPS